VKFKLSLTIVAGVILTNVMGTSVLAKSHDFSTTQVNNSRQQIEDATTSQRYKCIWIGCFCL
jgi:hypothetical protein